MSGGRKPERARRPGRRRALAPRERRRHRSGEAGSGDQTNPGAGTIASRHRRRQQRGPRPGAAAGRGGRAAAVGHSLPLGEGGGPAAAPHHCYLSSRTRERGREAGRERWAGGSGRARSVRRRHWLVLPPRSPGWELGAGAPP